ncbi:MAG: hypothetical protein ABSC25_14245 [Roseiarcus sp.]
MPVFIRKLRNIVAKISTIENYETVILKNAARRFSGGRRKQGIRRVSARHWPSFRQEKPGADVGN